VYKVQTNKLWTPFPPPPWGLILAHILTPTQKANQRNKKLPSSIHPSS